MIQDVKYIICSYVSEIWVNEAIFLFPDLKYISHKIPTYLMSRNEIKNDKLRRKSVAIMAKRLLKMRIPSERHTIYFNTLYKHEIINYCSHPNENLIQIRIVSNIRGIMKDLKTDQNYAKMTLNPPQIFPIEASDILTLGPIYSLSLLSEIDYDIAIPWWIISDLLLLIQSLV